MTAPDQVCRGLTDVDGSLPRRLIPASGFTKFSPVGASFPVLPQFSLRPISLFPSAISCSESRPQPVRPDLSGSHGCLFSLLVCPLSDEPQRSLGTLLSQFLLLSFHCLFFKSMAFNTGRAFKSLCKLRKDLCPGPSENQLNTNHWRFGVLCTFPQGTRLHSPR